MVVKPKGPTKKFEWTIPFTELDGKSYPIVEVKFLTQLGAWIPIPLIFDSGAEVTLLLPRYAENFPAGEEELIGVVGSSNAVPAPVIKGIEVDFLGQSAKRDIIIRQFPCHPFVGGLFGRDCLKPFGFGYWEGSRELYVTLKP